ncbi:ALK and LTK ligand 2b [Trichomycterus rosablanca]|uniref:ALK and LTK ligand 2b n=1 Tax=Trichomycterus rosablanca TaxID=2290929 RepID=UPI002F355093
MRVLGMLPDTTMVSGLRAERATAGLRVSMSVLRAPDTGTPALLLLLMLVMVMSGGSCTLLQLLADGGRGAEHQPEPTLSGKKDYSIVTTEGNEVNKSHQHDQILEVFPRDLRQKEKIIKHLTGPLYFSPKCSKRFYRLYHNTRDCKIPAYYKRCARLLRRLAESQLCSEG